MSPPRSFCILCLTVVLSEIIVEGHRFDILEEIGCEPNYYNVTLAYPISLLWPPVILTITLVYGGALGSSDLSSRLTSHHTLGLNIRLFWRSSQMVNGMLGSNKNPNQSRYIRLIVLSASQIITSLPLSLFNLYANAFYLPVHPWISWDDTHANYSHVNQFPSVMWRAGPTSGPLLELNRWIIVIAALLFFAFFGFAEEARRHYRKAYSFATSSLRLSDSRKGGSKSGERLPTLHSFQQFRSWFQERHRDVLLLQERLFRSR